ncbi:hypothetical protein NPIL_497701 [Nephila pilipes]|uniref:Uncharacterized protein n=1 Tax=Nephila pilipes TaxID=299642 RepID=A0A8X6Q7J7_NEPPI|nr:hypothetical protein NPIL_497701 [Nephila pilipes]
MAVITTPKPRCSRAALHGCMAVLAARSVRLRGGAVWQAAAAAAFAVRAGFAYCVHALRAFLLAASLRVLLVVMAKMNRRAYGRCGACCKRHVLPAWCCTQCLLEQAGRWQAGGSARRACFIILYN